MDNGVERANFYHMVADIAWFGLALSATTRFLSIYAIRLGATPLELGLIASLPGLMLLLSTGFATWWRRHFSNSVQAVNLPSWGFRLVFLLPAFTPFMPERFQVIWLIMSAVLPAIPQGISSAVFVTMMREAIPDRLLPRLWSRRLVVMNITLALSTVAFGYLLEVLPFPFNYQLMFLLSFGFTAVSMWHISHIKVLFPMPTTQTPEKLLKFLNIVAKIKQTPTFLPVVFVVMMTHLAFFSINAIVPLFLVENMGATEEVIAWFGLAELLAGAVSAALADRIMARIGSRALITLCMVGTGLAALCVAFAPSLPFTLLSAALTGATWTAATIGIFSFFLERTPADQMQSMTIVYQQMIAVGLFLGPLIGSVMADSGMNLVIVVLFGAMLRFVGGGLIAQLRPSRPAEPVAPSPAAPSITTGNAIGN